ncbi:amidohydrolase family protein [candidate division KSB1 bacterium]|nr:amidohydrolase family protein [candidate division KSB1 bacterium]
MPFYVQAQGVLKAPPRAEGEGPFERLIIYGGILIDGTGAPPIGPMTIIVEQNRITQIRSAGNPGLPMRPAPQIGPNDKLVDATGMYIMPGFIDMHAHMGGSRQGTPAEYVYKLWLGHGITTIRDPGSGNGFDWSLEAQEKSNNDEITAPRIEVYTRVGGNTPEEARQRVVEAAQKGANGLKLGSMRPDIMRAVLDEARRQGIRTGAHLAQMGVVRMNALDAAKMGLTTLEHWYGLPESMFYNQVVQDFPLDYNYNNEQDRFGQAGRLWKQAAEPFSEHWYAIMDEFLALDFTFVPTMTIYEASRDLMRARRAEWHDEYTLPSLWRFYKPDRNSHGSYWFYWTTEDEIAWKRNYQLWMAFLNEYKNRGGRVATGSDSGFIYKLYGFGYIRELELLREAGFHPLEVIRSATLMGAEALGRDDEIGSIEVGKLADFAIVEENPLQNLKVLYGTGAIKLNENNEPIRVGGIKYTIKNGIVYDAKELLADVRKMVADAKKKENFEIIQPGAKKKGK